MYNRIPRKFELVAPDSSEMDVDLQPLISEECHWHSSEKHGASRGYGPWPLVNRKFSEEARQVKTVISEECHWHSSEIMVVCTPPVSEGCCSENLHIWSGPARKTSTCCLDMLGKLLQHHDKPASQVFALPFNILGQVPFFTNPTAVINFWGGSKIKSFSGSCHYILCLLVIPLPTLNLCFWPAQLVAIWDHPLGNQPTFWISIFSLWIGMSSCEENTLEPWMLCN